MAVQSSVESIPIRFILPLNPDFRRDLDCVVVYSPERSVNAKENRPLKQEELHSHYSSSLCHRRQSGDGFLSESVWLSETRPYERPRWKAHARRIVAAGDHPDARAGDAGDGSAQRQ